MNKKSPASKKNIKKSISDKASSVKSKVKNTSPKKLAAIGGAGLATAIGTAVLANYYMKNQKRKKATEKFHNGEGPEPPKDTSSKFMFPDWMSLNKLYSSRKSPKSV